MAEPVTVPALDLAERLHRGHVRKGTQIPYLSHLLAVSALVLEDGGSEVEAAAALLHDAAENHGGHAALKLIAQNCGSEVAHLVEECSDSLLAEGEEKADWWERKREAVARVSRHSHGALRIIAADKLHNAQATVADLERGGHLVWSRFKTGREGFLWYHQEMARTLRQHLPGSRSVDLLEQVLVRLEHDVPRSLGVFVRGRPTGYASGEHEQRWKAAVRDAFAGVSPRPKGRLALHLDFVLDRSQVGSRAPDLDNLIKSTVDALGGVLGLRAGNWRTAQADDERIDRIFASKRLARVDESSGASIEVRSLRQMGASS